MRVEVCDPKIEHCETSAFQQIVVFRLDINLRFKTFKMFVQIDIASLQHLVKVLGCQLENLSLRNCNRLHGESILPLVQVKMQLFTCFIPSNILSEVCKNLKCHNYSAFFIKKTVLSLQEHCPNLISLDLSSTSVRKLCVEKLQVQLCLLVME